MKLIKRLLCSGYMPLEVSKMARANRCKTCCDVDYAQPNFGYCASQKTRFFGYKLRTVCSVEGVFTSFDLTTASVHDIHYLKDIKQQLSDCVIKVTCQRVFRWVCSIK